MGFTVSVPKPSIKPGTSGPGGTSADEPETGRPSRELMRVENREMATQLARNRTGQVRPNFKARKKMTGKVR